jgi:hypothetical protein
MCVAAWSDLPNEASIGSLSRGGDDAFYFLPVPSQLSARHIIIKALASMDNQNNTKVMRYLDGGDVCWFVFGVGGIVGGGSGSGSGGKRVHLIDHSTEILIPWPFQPHPHKC